MILRMQQLIKVIQKLFNLELYEDLCLFVELNLPTEPSKMFMNCDELDDDQRGYILYCLANSYAQLNQFSQAIRNYEMAIRYISNIKHRKLQNRYEHVLNTAELRFQMHKLYLQNRQEEEAFHCLESIPRTELTPKVLLAMAHLCHQLAKAPAQQSQSSRALFNKRADVPNIKIVNYYKAIIKYVPEAIYCQSYLISVGAIKANQRVLHGDQQQHKENENLFMTSEIRLWNEVKQLQAQKCYLEAAKLLDNPPNGTKLRFLLEQARFYRMNGDHQKALACYQQAHLLDSTNAEGMDAFAALLGMHNNSQQIQRELDSLAGKMLNSNPRRPESFVIYGWAQRQSHRANEAKLFAQRGEQLAPRRGQQRSECCLLKAQLLFDTRRHFKEMEIVLADGLHNDSTNTAIYFLYIQMFISQKRYAEAQRMAKTSMKFVGEQNHQIRFLLAQALADDPTDGGISGTENAINILEKMVQGGHLTLDPLLLLSRLYDRQQKYEKAIALLNRFKESYGDPRIHRELGDLLSKTNRPGEALGEYGQAMGSLNGTDTSAKIINLMGGFTTPQCAVNAAFENSGGIAGGSSDAGPADSREIRIMPPPVARVTRRTAINQHEQLRRLRGMGTLSATGSVGGGSSTRIGTQTRRLTMNSRGTGPSSSNSSGRSEMLVASGLSPVLAPLHFDDDQHEGNGTSEVAETSDEGSDSSQLSLDDEDGAAANSESFNSGNQHSSSSTALEQSRALDNSLANGTDLRDVVRGLQRYLAANPSDSAASTPSATTTSSSIRNNREAQTQHLQQHRPSAGSSRAAMTSTTTVQQRLVAISSFDDDVAFVSLIADEPLMERDVPLRIEDEGGRMSIDNSTAGGDLLILSEDDEEMNN